MSLLDLGLLDLGLPDLGLADFVLIDPGLPDRGRGALFLCLVKAARFFAFRLPSAIFRSPAKLR